MSRFSSLCHQQNESGRLMRSQERIKEETRCSQLEGNEVDQTLEITLALCVGKAEGIGCSTTDAPSALASLKTMTEFQDAYSHHEETKAIIARAQTCLALVPHETDKHNPERDLLTRPSLSPQVENSKVVSKQRYQLLLGATEKGDMFAMFHLAICFDIGDGVKEDKDKALQLYKRASEMGHPKAMVNLGVFLERQGPGQDHKTALELFQRAADLGDDDAVTNLGICFAQGYGTEQNNRKAIELFWRARDMGNIHATTRLGLCYFKGDSLIRDIGRGLKLIEEGAEMGDGMALFCLGACYFRGEGTVQDQQKGLLLLQKASDQGVPGALLFLGTCYKQGHLFVSDETKSKRNVPADWERCPHKILVSFNDRKANNKQPNWLL